MNKADMMYGLVVILCLSAGIIGLEIDVIKKESHVLKYDSDPHWIRLKECTDRDRIDFSENRQKINNIHYDNYYSEPIQSTVISFGFDGNDYLISR